MFFKLFLAKFVGDQFCQLLYPLNAAPNEASTQLLEKKSVLEFFCPKSILLSDLYKFSSQLYRKVSYLINTFREKFLHDPFKIATFQNESNFLKSPCSQS